MCQTCDHEDRPVFPVTVRRQGGVLERMILCQQCLKNLRKQNRAKVRSGAMSVEIIYSRSQLSEVLGAAAGKV